VRGYKEEGTTTTPFDMVVLNDLDRFHLANGRHGNACQNLNGFCAYGKTGDARQSWTEHNLYVRKYGEDMPEIRDWRWPY